MKEMFEEFVGNQLTPLLTKETGFKKSGTNSFKKVGDRVCLMITIEPDRFNYAGRYGFNILIHLIGLKPGTKPSGNLSSMVKNGSIIISTINIKDIIDKVPVPYELRENNKDELIAEIKADIEEESFKKWLYINDIKDVEAIMMLPENSKFIYNLAVYFAIAGEKEKSRQYFILIKNQGSIVLQAASSLGIDLN